MAPKTTTLDTLILHNKEALTFLKDVSLMERRLRLLKTKEGIVVMHGNEARSLVFKLVLPKSSFDFHGEEIGFYNFPEFYQLLDTFSTPQINQLEHELVLSEGGTKIVYKLAEPSILPESPKWLDLDMPTTFTIKEKDLRDFRKMIGLINADLVRVEANSKGVVLTLSKNERDHSFQRTFALDKSVKGAVHSFLTTTDVLSDIPVGDYVVGIVKTPQTYIMKCSLVSSKLVFDVCTGEAVD